MRSSSLDNIKTALIETPANYYLTGVPVPSGAGGQMADVEVGNGRRARPSARHIARMLRDPRCLGSFQPAVENGSRPSAWAH
jgi:hypothetical protein